MIKRILAGTLLLRLLPFMDMSRISLPLRHTYAALLWPFKWHWYISPPLSSPDVVKAPHTSISHSSRLPCLHVTRYYGALSISRNYRRQFSFIAWCRRLSKSRSIAAGVAPLVGGLQISWRCCKYEPLHDDFRRYWFDMPSLSARFFSIFIWADTQFEEMRAFCAYIFRFPADMSFIGTIYDISLPPFRASLKCQDDAWCYLYIYITHFDDKIMHSISSHHAPPPLPPHSPLPKLFTPTLPPASSPKAPGRSTGKYQCYSYIDIRNAPATLYEFPSETKAHTAEQHQPSRTNALASHYIQRADIHCFVLHANRFHYFSNTKLTRKIHAA